MTTHATPGDLCTDDCRHICGHCALGYVEACEDFILLPTGAEVACVKHEEQPVTIDTWHTAAWMQTFTGRAFRPFHAKPEDIDARDIARSLSMTCRYNGHVSRFYSVAEHCVLMSETFDDHELALWALAHDAAEAYIGDMVRPLKVTEQMEAYRRLDRDLTAVIASKWGLNGTDMPREVKDADNRILLDERAELLGAPVEAWGQDTDGTKPLGVRIRGWQPAAAELMFLRRLDYLGVRS